MIGRLGIWTSAIEEKCQALEMPVIYWYTLHAQFTPYLAQSLELTLPSLRFYLHDGVLLRQCEQHPYNANGLRQLPSIHLIASNPNPNHPSWCPCINASLICTRLYAVPVLSLKVEANVTCVFSNKMLSSPNMTSDYNTDLAYETLSM